MPFGTISSLYIPSAFNGTTGLSVADDSANANYGFARGSFIAGLSGFGNALLCNGVDSNDTSQGAISGPLQGLTTFTLECLYRKDRNAVATEVPLSWFSFNGSNTGSDWSGLYFNNMADGRQQLIITNGTATFNLIQSLSTLSTGVTYRIAAQSSGGVVSYWIDGVFQGSVSVVPVISASQKVSVGRYPFERPTPTTGDPGATQGAFDSVRLSSAARYTHGANYTVATAPFTTDANTVLLWQLNSGISATGTRISALDDAADAAEGATTIVNFTSNSTERRPVSPYQQTGSGQTINPGQTSGNGAPAYGFVIPITDASSARGARRFYAAGTHTLNFYALGGNTLGNNLYRAQIYRVSADGATKTFIAGNSAGVNGSGLGAAVAIPITAPMIVLQPAETIQYCIDCGVTNTLLASSVTFTFGTGGVTAGNTVAVITTPEFGILANGRGNSDGAATTDGRGSYVLGARGDSAGIATADGILSATAGFVGNSAGVATVDGRLGALAGFVGTSDGVASVDGRLGATAGFVGSSSGTSTADGILSATAGFVGTSDGVASTDGHLGAIAAFHGDSAGSATVDGRASSVAGSVGSSAGVATVDGRLGAIIGAYGTVVIGAAGQQTEYPDGLIRLRPDGRKEAVRAGSGQLPPGTLRITTVA